MSKEKIILVGGGGHCKAVIDVIESAGEFEIVGILDIPEKVGQQILGYKIIGTDDQIPDFIKDCPNFHLTVGQIQSSVLRKKLFTFIKESGGSLPVLKSKSAVVSKHSKVGAGAVIMHQTTINAGAEVGDCCILNNGSLIEHDATVGSFSHVSTNAVVNGDCKVGAGCFVGSNATLSNGVSIPDNTLIAAGGVVYRSLKISGTYLGFPLRKIK